MDDTIYEMLEKIERARTRLLNEAVNLGWATKLGIGEIDSIMATYKKRCEAGDDPPKATFMTFLETASIGKADIRVDRLINAALLATVLKHSKEVTLELIARELNQLRLPDLDAMGEEPQG